MQGREEEILIIYGQFNPKYLIFSHLFTAQQACCFYCCNDFTLIYCCTSYYKTLPAGLGVSKQEKKGKYEQKKNARVWLLPTRQIILIMYMYVYQLKSLIV